MRNKTYKAICTAGVITFLAGGATFVINEIRTPEIIDTTNKQVSQLETTVDRIQHLKYTLNHNSRYIPTELLTPINASLARDIETRRAQINALETTPEYLKARADETNTISAGLIAIALGTILTLGGAKKLDKRELEERTRTTLSTAGPMPQ